MKTSEKIEKLNAAAVKAQNTINRVQNWEANKSNAAAHLMAINAAAVILSEDTTDENVNAAVEYLHTQFMAQFNAQAKARVKFEASFSEIKAAAASNPYILAYAVNAKGFNFDAAIRGCYSAISAADKAARAEKWKKTLDERAARAADNSKKANINADKAARAAAVKASKARAAADKAAAKKNLK